MSRSRWRKVRRPIRGKELALGINVVRADLTPSQKDAIVKKLGGYEMAIRFLHDELVVSEPTRLWYERDGVVYFSVTSDGTTGEEWVKRLKSKMFNVCKYAKSILLSSEFKPTWGITTKIAVLKNFVALEETRDIRIEGKMRGLFEPNAETACLIREKLTDKDIEEMGLVSIFSTHEPIEDSCKVPCLLGAGRWNGGRSLRAYCGRPGSRWTKGNGFAFAVSQTGPQMVLFGFESWV